MTVGHWQRQLKKQRVIFNSLKGKAALTLPKVTLNSKIAVLLFEIFRKLFLLYYFLVRHRCYHKSFHIFLKGSGRVSIFWTSIKDLIVFSTEYTKIFSLSEKSFFSNKCKKFFSFGRLFSFWVSIRNFFFFLSLVWHQGFWKFIGKTSPFIMEQGVKRVRLRKQRISSFTLNLDLIYWKKMGYIESELIPD